MNEILTEREKKELKEKVSKMKAEKIALFAYKNKADSNKSQK